MVLFMLYALTFGSYKPGGIWNVVCNFHKFSGMKIKLLIHEESPTWQLCWDLQLGLGLDVFSRCIRAFYSLNLCTFSFRHSVYQARATVRPSRKSWRTCVRLRRSWRSKGRKKRRRVDAVGDCHSIQTPSAEAALPLHAAHKAPLAGPFVCTIGATMVKSLGVNAKKTRLPVLYLGCVPL